MLGFITENIGTIVVLLAVTGIVAAIVIKMIKDKKKGKSACGCDCSKCSCGCSNNNQ